MRTSNCFMTYFLVISSRLFACDINYEKLDQYAKTLVSQISQGTVVEKKDIPPILSFATPSGQPLKWNQDEFTKLIEEKKSEKTLAIQKFGHNRFGTFFNEAQEAFNESEANFEKYKIYKLCELISSKMIEIMNSSKNDVEEGSIIPDQQLSFVTSTAHLTPRSGSVSQGSIHSTSTESTEINRLHVASDENGTEERTPFTINLDKTAFSQRSPMYYPKQLQQAKGCPLRILCDLQCVKMDQLDTLKNAALEIDKEKNLMEVIFKNGSSMKFNKLFRFFQDITKKHEETSKPIIIMFSTTSPSQQAYKKLYHLGSPLLSMDELLEKGTAAITTTSHKSILKHQIIETNFLNPKSSELINSLLNPSAMLEQEKDN